MCGYHIESLLSYFSDILKFLAGFGVAFFSYTWADNRKNEKTYNLFKDYLPRQVKATNRLIVFLNSLISKLEGELSFDVGAFALPAQPFFIADSISKIDLHKALDSKFNKKKIDFFETSTALNYLQKKYDEIISNYMIFVNEADSIRLELTKDLESFQDTRARLLAVDKEKIFNTPYLKYLNDVYNEWTTPLEKPPIKRTISVLLNPLETYFKKEYNNAPNNTDVVELLKRVQSIRYRYESLDELRKGYVLILKDTIASIEKELPNISKTT